MSAGWSASSLARSTAAGCCSRSSACTSLRFCCRSSISRRACTASAMGRNVSRDLHGRRAEKNGPDPPFHIGRGAAALVAARTGKDGGEPRALLGRKRGCGYAEMVAGGGLGPEHPLAPLGVIEIELEDAALGHRVLDHPGDRRLLRLAQPGARSGQEQVLRELL